MKEAYEEMRDLSGKGDSSEEEGDPDSEFHDLEKKGKNPYRRRGKNKNKYLIDVNVCGFPV